MSTELNTVAHTPSDDPRFRALIDKVMINLLESGAILPCINWEGSNVCSSAWYREKNAPEKWLEIIPVHLNG